MYRESHATDWQIKYTPSFPGWISRVPAHTCTVCEWWGCRPSTPSHLIHPFDRSSNPIRLDTMQPCSAVEHRTVQQHSSCGHIHTILQPTRALTPAPMQMLTCGYVGLNRCSTADARPDTASTACGDPPNSLPCMRGWLFWGLVSPCCHCCCRCHFLHPET